MEYVQSKDPSEVLDYQVDWSNELVGGDTISTSSWSVESGLTKDSDSKTTTTTTVLVSGGTAGVEYTATNTITTANGLTHEKTLIIPVLSD